MAKKQIKKKGGAPKKKRKKAELLPQLKKDASVFLSSEEGKMTKENVVKTAAALGIIGAALLKSAPAPAPRARLLAESGGGGQHVSHGTHGRHR